MWLERDRVGTDGRSATLSSFVADHGAGLLGQHMSARPLQNRSLDVHCGRPSLTTVLRAVSGWIGEVVAGARGNTL